MKKLSLLLMFVAGIFFAQPAFAGAGFKNYKPSKNGDIIEKSVSAGKSVLLDFYASWCTTCRAQGRVIDRLAAENPSYKQNIVFVRVDWDKYQNSDLAKRYGVPRRSTLVMIKGGKPVGKLVAQVGKGPIKALLDKGI